MADPSTDTDDDIDFELERVYDRSDLAAVFRAFATAFEDGAPVRLTGDDASATVTVPPRVAVELEAERDDDPPIAELELDLEWDDPDGSSIRVATGESDGEDEETVVAEASDATRRDDGQDEQRDKSTTDPAMATIPPEGVPGNQEQAGSEPGDSDEQPRSSGRTSRFEVYQDRAEEWRWRLVHWNGNIVADSGEGYTSRSNARRAARSVMRSAPTATVVDRDETDQAGQADERD